MKNEIIKGDIEILPTDLFRNIHGGIDAKMIHLEYGEIPSTLDGDLLERAESGEFGEIAPLPESHVKRKLINEQKLIIDYSLAIFKEHQWTLERKVRTGKDIPLEAGELMAQAAIDIESARDQITALNK
jgi:hypothetical protein